MLLAYNEIDKRAVTLCRHRALSQLEFLVSHRTSMCKVLKGKDPDLWRLLGRREVNIIGKRLS